MTNDELYEKAVEAIDNLWSDNSVSLQDCKDTMNCLIGEIQVYLDMIEQDLEAQKGE